MRAVKTIPAVTTVHVRTDIDGTVSPIGVKVCECLLVGEIFLLCSLLICATLPKNRNGCRLLDVMLEGGTALPAVD